MIAGHMITVMIARRPRIYVVCETCPQEAVARLRHKLGEGLDVPLSPLPISDTIIADHGLRPGQMKQLHL